MVLFTVPLVTDPVTVQLLYFIHPAVPSKAQRAQLSILEIRNYFDGFKNIFEGHVFYPLG